jgi:hypothetical protein
MQYCNVSVGEFREFLFNLRGEINIIYLLSATQTIKIIILKQLCVYILYMKRLTATYSVIPYGKITFDLRPLSQNLTKTYQGIAVLSINQKLFYSVPKCLALHLDRGSLEVSGGHSGTVTAVSPITPVFPCKLSFHQCFTLIYHSLVVQQDY